MAAGVWPCVLCPDSLWTDVLSVGGGVSPTYISWTLLAAFASQSVGTMDPGRRSDPHTPMPPSTLGRRHCLSERVSASSAPQGSSWVGARSPSLLFLPSAANSKLMLQTSAAGFAQAGRLELRKGEASRLRDPGRNLLPVTCVCWLPGSLNVLTGLLMSARSSQETGHRWGVSGSPLGLCRAGWRLGLTSGWLLKGEAAG